MPYSSCQPAPCGEVGTRDVPDVICYRCGRACKGNRGLQSHLRGCRKRDRRVEGLQYARTTVSGGAVPSGPEAIRPGVPVVVLERLPSAVVESSAGTRRRKRRRRSAESGDGGTTGIPRGLAVPGSPGSSDSDGSSKQTVHGGAKRLKSASTPTVGSSSSGGELADTSGCVEGLSHARTPAQDSSGNGLSSARTPAGGSVTRKGSHSRGSGCVDGLSHARTPTVSGSGSSIDNSHTVASIHLLAGDAMPRTRSPPRSSGGGRSGSSAAGEHTCSSCRRVFGTFMGLRQHERRTHPADYHAGLAIGHRTGNKRRWEHEEKVLVAREELRLRKISQVNLNARIAVALPNRTLEAIKCLRRNPAYRAMLDDMESSLPVVEPAQPAPGDVLDGLGGEGRGTFDPTIPSNPEDACTKLVEACRGDAAQLCLSSDELDEVIDLALGSVRDPSVTASGRIQALVDLEYGRHAIKLASTGRPETNTRVRSDERGPRRTRRCRGTRREQEAPRPPSKRTLRRRLYGVIQTLYRKNRSRCAKTVLSGDWAKERRAAKLEEQDAYWRPLFEEPSALDSREPETVSRPLYEISLPVTKEEYERVLSSTQDSSPGLDGVDRKALRRMDPQAMIAHMNLWLLAGRPPGDFKIGVTVPIPKSADAAEPSEYRPITVSSMVCRIFHRLLAQRAERCLPLGSRQKAFREGDGLADNVWILRSIIDDCKVRHRPLCVTFVDVRKAFDTVSHESVVKAAERIGFPPALVSYIRCLYIGGVTKIRAGGALGSLIRPSRGVRQGDPLSPLLFCAVMHWVLTRLDDRLGLELAEGVRVNHLAFADDVALVSSSPEAMQRMLCELEHGMREVGLSPNPAKSASLRIAVTGKARKWFCPAESFLSLDGSPVPTIDIAGSYRYLGIRAGAGPSAKIGSEVTRKLEEGIRQLSKAPLKPQQRLFILRVHLLPSLYHELVLSSYYKKLLQYLDRRSREAVRRWLHLPHDVPQPFFHARAVDGGLGIPELQVQIPLMRRARVESLFNRASWTYDPVLSAVIGRSKALLKERKRFFDGVACYEKSVTDRTDQGRATAAALYRSCDGCGLADTGQVPSVNRWVNSGTCVLSGRSFINALHVRAGCLYTKVRAGRGRTSESSGTDGAGMMCEVCPCRRESLAHVVQQCPRSAHARTERHNTVLKLLSKGLTDKGFTVEAEPAIKTDQGIRRPDVVAYRPGETAVIIDVTVVADLPGELPDSHARKCRKYDLPEIRTWLSKRAGVSTTSVKVTALTFNWRGALCPQSARDMKVLGITMPMLEIMSMRVLEWGHTAWRESRDATWIQMDALPSGPGYLRQTGSADGTGGSSGRHFLGRRPPAERHGPLVHSNQNRSSGGMTGGRRSRRRPGPEGRVAAGIRQ